MCPLFVFTATKGDELQAISQRKNNQFLQGGWFQASE